MRSWVPIVVAALFLTACSGRGFLKKQYEYEEEVYLALDGTASVNVNASVPALVALRGANLNVNPQSRFDRDAVRTFFRGPGATITALSSSRRYGRRFVHVSLDVADVRSLQQLAPFAWSTYQFARDGDVYDFKQTVGAPAGKEVGNVGWDGTELVTFRLHLPSHITGDNAPVPVQRGNILEWEQPLADRLHAAPVDMQVQMETQTILANTLLLFGSTIVAALLTIAAILWWVARKGRDSDIAVGAGLSRPPRGD
jgi:hypothetical protein